MTESTPRFLGRQRLQKLVLGLRERMSSSSKRIAHEVEQLRDQLRTLELDHHQKLMELKSAGQRSLNELITQWDTARHMRWTECETRAFTSIHGYAAREAAIRAGSRQQAEEINTAAKQKVAAIENHFMQAKNVPIALLREFKNAFEQKNIEINNVQQSCANLLAQRGVSAAIADAPVTAVDLPNTAKECLQASQRNIAEAAGHLDRVINNPLSNALRSIWLWFASIFIAVATAAGLGAFQVVAWPIALAVGMILAIVLIGGAQLVAFPWLRKIALAEYPRVQLELNNARQATELGSRLALRESEEELKRLADKRDAKIDKVAKRREHDILELNAKLKQQLEQLTQSLANEKRIASEQLTQSIATTDQQFKSRQQEFLAEHERTISTSESAFTSTQSQILAHIERIDRSGARRLLHATSTALRFMERGNTWCQRQFPTWSDTAWQQRQWPDRLEQPIFPFGSLVVDDILHEDVRAATSGQRVAAVTFEPIRDNYLTVAGDPASDVAQQTIRNLILRALTSIPAGKTHVCVIDPPSLGRDFGWLMHLADFDPQLVTHRVWTQPGHIAKQVEQLARAAEDFIQQSLRNQYRSIVEYNREAGSLAEPYRLLVWSSFPAGLDEQSWKSLQSLLDSGSRCGIIPILLIDPALPWPSSEHREYIQRRGLHLTVAQSEPVLSIQEQGFQDLKVLPPMLPHEDQQQWLVEESGRQSILAARVEVPLKSIVPPREQHWTADSSKSLDIPIGQSGVGRIHSMKLGIGTAQHAIIAGKTGSGKSTLLHALITAAAVKYAPDRLRMVLLDFKKGVEFQVYGQGRLPHADIIGIESEREFGLSALEHVDRCMQLRGQMFREAGVQDLASWNLVHPEQPLPRVLIVIDEFQELFVEDDKLSNQASLILDRIVRQGRSFGVHSILSSQTLAGAYSLPRTTMGQMSVRVALQCDAADAQMIFADDNPAASRLKHPGQAVYNDAGGRIEGNQMMQIGWLTKQEQIAWFEEFPRGYRNSDPSTNMLGRTVVYEGNRASQWDSAGANMAIDRARATLNASACWCVLGESVAINPAVVVPLTLQAGRNLLVVGAEDSQAAAVLNSIIASFIHHHQNPSARVVFVQAAKPTDACALRLGERVKVGYSNCSVIEARGVEQSLAELHAQLKDRIDGVIEESNWIPTLLVLVQIGRLRTLRKEDEFGLGSFGETAATPDKLLEEILRDGPSHGIHTAVWAENASTANRWLSRTALREIEVRILMQMGANDSTNLIDSVAASQLNPHVMLVHDDATSTTERFRPYDYDSLDLSNDWANQEVGGTP